MDRLRAVRHTVVENLRSAVYASYEELSAQLQAASALDAKLLGLLGFFAVAGSLLTTFPHGLHGGGVLLLSGVGSGALACIVGITAAAPDTGPRPREFYADYGAESERYYLAQLLSDLSATSALNRGGLANRRRALKVALNVPILLAILYGLWSVA